MKHDERATPSQRPEQVTYERPRIEDYGTLAELTASKVRTRLTSSEAGTTGAAAGTPDPVSETSSGNRGPGGDPGPLARSSCPLTRARR